MRSGGLFGSGRGPGGAWVRSAGSLVRRGVSVRRLLAIAAFGAALVAGAGALGALPTALAEGSGTAFMFSAPQTVPSEATSADVFVQLQSTAATPEPVYQSANYTIDVTCTSTTITVFSCPTTVTIPAGSFYTTFTFSATNPSPTATSTLVVTLNDPLGDFASTAQDETIGTSGSALTAVSAGTNSSGNGGVVAPGQSATYSAVSVTNNNVSGSLYYYLAQVNGAFASGGLGVITGVPACSGAIAFGDSWTPSTISVGVSPYRPAGSYTLGFVVESFSAAGCTGTPTGYFMGTTNLQVNNGAYTPLTPTRILDTRSPGANYGPLGPGGTLDLAVTGTFNGQTVPSDATAVVMNVTAVDTSTASFLSVYPNGGAPGTSNLNWQAGETVANLVTVGVGTGGKVDFYNNVGNTDVLADLQGYYQPGAIDSGVGTFVPLTPSRICDTRPTSESGISDSCTGHTLTAGGTLTLPIEGGGGGVPSTDVAAVVVNVTVVDTTAASFLSVYPSTSAPGSSNLNWSPGDTVANRVMVDVAQSGPDGGDITIYNNLGHTDVIVDVNGYISSSSSIPAKGALFTPLSTPSRILDTRQTGQTLGANGSVTEQVANQSGLDPFGPTATAVVMNVTAVDTSTVSFLSVYPAGVSRPNESDVNWGTGATVPNLCVVALGTGSAPNLGAVTIFNAVGRADVVLDVFGYYSAA